MLKVHGFFKDDKDQQDLVLEINIAIDPTEKAKAEIIETSERFFDFVFGEDGVIVVEEEECVGV